MQVKETKDNIIAIKDRFTKIRGYFDIERLKSRLTAIENELSSEKTWGLPERLRELQTERSYILQDIDPLEDSASKIAYLEELLSIVNEEGGDQLNLEIQKEIDDIKEVLDNIELKLLFSGEVDRNNAIVTIHPGSGGTESQDWAEMLMRMYLRWAEKHGFEVEIADLQTGDEAGIKDATFTIKGDFAYGYMKGEAGIHRLVRISPFDANKRRHTSFAAIFVCPEIEDAIKVEIRDEDLKMDTFRASGAGGQHVNKVSSAVRITHIPSGMIVSCQSERSQIRNKDSALKILKSRLYDITLKEREKKIDDIVGNKKDISWGNQIRSYILQPYRLVKDHRTGVEIGNVDAVLDGSIDDFIKGFLIKSSKRSNQEI
ncbi:MAG: peptide chain release factor 2 [Nitrospirae bacterium]|nr:peptide chain release factor 2 [Nitrospirota bacterium]